MLEIDVLLTCEKKPPISNPSKAEMRKALEALRSFGPSSFATLTREDGSFVQVGGGLVTCMLEWKDTATARHYRANQETPSTPFPDGSILSFGGGDIPLLNNEWFNIQQVIPIFEAFLDVRSFPANVKWRDITALFGEGQAR